LKAGVIMRSSCGVIGQMIGLPCGVEVVVREEIDVLASDGYVVWHG
jgi:hypothetical protein